jgi:hypothetical protein
MSLETLPNRRKPAFPQYAFKINGLQRAQFIVVG